MGVRCVNIFCLLNYIKENYPFFTAKKDETPLSFQFPT